MNRYLTIIREADKEAVPWEIRVTITFEHFGEPINPLEQHMMEKGEPNKSLTKRSAAAASVVSQKFLLTGIALDRQ